MTPIRFNDGFSVVYGDVESTHEDQHEHNLGKTSLVHLIDFLFLKGGGGIFGKYKEKFSGWVFFMELDLGDQRFLTVRRSVDNPSKIAFKLHKIPDQDLSDETSWDHKDVGIHSRKQEGAIELLEKYLSFDVASDFGYRHFLAYLLRTQYEYDNVFKMKEFQGKDVDWKPQLFNLLGFNEKSVLEKYRINIEIDTINNLLKTIVGNADYVKEAYTIRAAIAEKEKEQAAAKRDIDKFDFYIKETGLNKDLIQTIEANISRFNSERYRLQYEVSKIKESLETKPEFSLEEIEQVFSEVRLYFPDNLKKDYRELIEFNTNLSTERAKYLGQLLKDNTERLEEVDKNLKELNDDRQNTLAVLKQKDTFQKYKALQDDLRRIDDQIRQYNERLRNLASAENYEQKKSLLKEDAKVAAKEVKRTIDSGNEIFDSIKELFTKIYKETMKTTAVVLVRPNKEGNPEFEAKTLGEELEQLTGKSEGYTSTKVQCAAFVFAVLATYSLLGKRFFRFMYDDGLLEGWGNNPKVDFITAIREMTENYNIQYIVSMIKSDVPPGFEFKKGEIITTLSREHTLFGIDF